MATLTREQAAKWGAKLTNGFVFDVRHYVMWGEKHAAKDVFMPDGNILRATLEYNAETIGTGYLAKETGRQIPVLNLQKFTPDKSGTGLMSSVGWGQYHDAGEIQKNKSWAYLVKQTAKFPDEKCLELYASGAGKSEKYVSILDEMEESA